MTTTPDEPLSDDQMSTEQGDLTGTTPGLGDADGTDADGTDGTDGDSGDADGTDSGDADGTDGAAL
ncbi:hypothetical protein [Nocardioides sp. 616]|uniref:hypothetical protein n=1 Tax=Nocardioides sp. 616 TaxID=2268090 RepID=UPI000CE55C6D|nr:hypothetical protein [Nocardioides sp. 616]